MSRAFVFPGQGAQTIGMGRALAEAYPAARAVFEEVDAALGEKLSALIWEGAIEDLTLTKNAQPALMATSMAALRALDDAGFVNIVGMRNGYNGFSQVFDSKFNRRVAPDVMREVESRDFPDQSTGIFGTGAGYDRVDTVQWVPIKDTEAWLDWQEEVAKLVAGADAK